MPSDSPQQPALAPSRRSRVRTGRVDTSAPVLSIGDGRPVGVGACSAAGFVDDVAHPADAAVGGSDCKLAAVRVTSANRLGDMTSSASVIRFRAKLLRPAATAKASWTFLTMPKSASAKLPSRSMTSVEGTINGVPFRATLEPDGQKSHWLKVDRKLREAAGAEVGDVVALAIAPMAEEPEPKVPADLRRALARDPKVRALWSDITPIARRDWIHWVISAKQSATRARRIDNACSMLAAGKRRVCCFDRSGFYSKGFGAPEPS